MDDDRQRKTHGIVVFAHVSSLTIHHFHAAETRPLVNEFFKHMSDSSQAVEAKQLPIVEKQETTGGEKRNRAKSFSSRLEEICRAKRDNLPIAFVEIFLMCWRFGFDMFVVGECAIQEKAQLSIHSRRVAELTISHSLQSNSSVVTSHHGKQIEVDVKGRQTFHRRNACGCPQWSLGRHLRKWLRRA